MLNFTSRFCSAGAVMNPLLEELARESAGRWLLGNVELPDHEATRKIGARFGIMYSPTLVMLKDGFELKDSYFAGRFSVKGKLRAWIEEQTAKTAQVPPVEEVPQASCPDTIQVTDDNHAQVLTLSAEKPVFLLFHHDAYPASRAMRAKVARIVSAAEGVWALAEVETVFDNYDVFSTYKGVVRAPSVAALRDGQLVADGILAGYPVRDESETAAWMQQRAQAGRSPVTPSAAS